MAMDLGEGAAAPPPAPPPPPAFGLDAAHADFGRLVMAPPDSPARGRLQPSAALDVTVVAGVSVQVEVAVSTAHRLAAAVRGLTPPANATPVDAVDAFDYRYDTAAPADVPSTGRWVTVSVMQCAVGLEPEYVCVPSVEPKAYRSLRIANRSAHALLPGPVDVTAGDQFLMTTTLPAMPPGAETSHRLGLGVEEALRVARRTHFREATAGLFGGASSLVHEIEVELRNGLPAPVRVEVRERVPWPDPGEKKLEVEEVEVKPAWEAVEAPPEAGEAPVRGARRWRVSLGAGETTKLAARYEIRLPSDRVLVGGNRRV
jgi:hypothetical protein